VIFSSIIIKELFFNRSATGLIRKKLSRAKHTLKISNIWLMHQTSSPKTRESYSVLSSTSAPAAQTGGQTYYNTGEKKDLNTKILLNNFKLNMLCLDF